MCTGLETALLIGGLAMSAGGMAMSGIQQNQVSDYNAAVARNEAEQARQVGRINETLTRDDLRRQMSAQRAALARSGVSLGSGTALDLGQDAGEAAFIETQAVRSGAETRARGFESDARLSEFEGRAALMSGAFKGAGVLVDGATAFSRAGGFRKAGAGGVRQKAA